MSDYKHTYKCTVKREGQAEVDEKIVTVSTVVGVSQFQLIIGSSSRLQKSFRQEAYKDALKDARSRQASDLAYRTTSVSSEGSKVEVV